MTSLALSWMYKIIFYFPWWNVYFQGLFCFVFHSLIAFIMVLEKKISYCTKCHLEHFCLLQILSKLSLKDVQKWLSASLMSSDPHLCLLNLQLWHNILESHITCFSRLVLTFDGLRRNRLESWNFWNLSNIAWFSPERVCWEISAIKY